MNDEILQEISDFCRRSGLAESTFGRRAVNDAKLASRLRNGGRITSDTLDRIHSFIAAHSRPTNDLILQEISDFCRQTGLAESTFGRRALNDGKLASRLRNGGRIDTETLDRIRSFMASHSERLLSQTHGPLSVFPPRLSPPMQHSVERAAQVGSMKAYSRQEHHSIFISHTHADKPFVRRLRDDLLRHGVPRVWVDEAEIEIGDSLTAKIEQGLKETRYIGVVLSTRSIKAPWVKKELDIAMNREIASGDVVVLPLLYEKCELPEFLKGKLYADFTDPNTYEEVLLRLLRRLRA